jgi:hypothetical protein
MHWHTTFAPTIHTCIITGITHLQYSRRLNSLRRTQEEPKQLANDTNCQINTWRRSFPHPAPTDVYAPSTSPALAASCGSDRSAAAPSAATAAPPQRGAVHSRLVQRMLRRTDRPPGHANDQRRQTHNCHMNKKDMRYSTESGNPIQEPVEVSHKMHTTCLKQLGNLKGCQISTHPVPRNP